MCSQIYDRLPASLISVKGMNLANPEVDEEKYLSNLLSQHVPTNKGGDIASIPHLVFSLEHRKKAKKKINPQKCPPISAKLSRKFKIFTIPKNLKYNDFMPLHFIWKKYAEDILQLKKNDAPYAPESVQIQILKMDFHGALTIVTRAKCKTLIGIKGIVIKETKNTLKIITKQNVTKSIPKINAYFAFLIDGYLVTLNGGSIAMKPHQRVTRKFKTRLND